MRDPKIEEIYIYAIQARQSGQKRIPIYIFPFKMTSQNMEAFQKEYPSFSAFWNNLKIGYDLFKENLRELPVKVNAKGDYYF